MNSARAVATIARDAGAAGWRLAVLGAGACAASCARRRARARASRSFASRRWRRPGARWLAHRGSAWLWWGAFAEQARDDQQRDDGEQPCGHALGDRADPADVPAAGVVGMVGALDVAGDRVDLRVRELAGPERRHRVGADADRLGDLAWRCRCQRRDECAGDDAAARLDRVAAGAVEREELLSLRERAAARVDGRDRGSAERRDIGDQRLDLTLRERGARAHRLLAWRGERHAAGLEVEVGGERADATQARCAPADPLCLQAVTGGARLHEQRVARSDQTRRLASCRGRAVPVAALSALASKQVSASTPHTNATAASARLRPRLSGPPTRSADRSSALTELTVRVSLGTGGRCPVA